MKFSVCVDSVPGSTANSDFDSENRPNCGPEEEVTEEEATD